MKAWNKNAYNKTNGNNRKLDIANRVLNFTTADSEWELTLVKHLIQSSPTRFLNNPPLSKDRSHVLINYLDAKTTAKFMEFTHENYKKRIGEEFGLTI